MDAISALGVAGGILTVTEFSVELLSLAISEDFPQHIAEPLLRLVDSELEMGKKRGGTRKRHRESWGDGPYGTSVKQVRGELR